LGLKDRVFPKEKNFHKMLSNQASKTLEGIGALVLFVENYLQYSNSQNSPLSVYA